MRKTLSLLCLALAVTTASLVTLARPVRSNLGGENAEGSEDPSYTIADYIQDGLIAMWDGEFNAIAPDGTWYHDPDARVWYAIVGGGYLNLPSNASFIEEGLYFDRSTTGAYKWTSQTSSPFWSDYVAALDAGAVTFENAYTLYEYGESSGSGMADTIRNIVDPAVSAYGHLCLRDKQTIYLTSNCMGTGYYWLSALVPATEGCHSMSATYDASGVRWLNNLYFDGVFKGCRVNPDSHVADENISFRSLRTGQFMIGARYGVATVDVINNFRIYSRVLSPEEVRHNALIDKARFGL